MITVAGDVWLRHRPNRKHAIVAGVMAVAGIVTGVAFAAGTRDLLGIGFGAFVIYGAYVLGRAAWGGSHAGVMLTRTEVLIRGPFVRRSVPLGQVEGFVAGGTRGARWNRRPAAGIFMVETGGERSMLWALSSDAKLWKMKEAIGEWQPTAERLNQLLAQRKGRSTARAAAS